MEKVKVQVKELNRSCKVGQAVKWETIISETFQGMLPTWDSNVGIVRLVDGKQKAVEC